MAFLDFTGFSGLKAGLKILCSHERAGSSPAPGTEDKSQMQGAKCNIMHLAPFVLDSTIFVSDSPLPVIFPWLFIFNKDRPGNMMHVIL